MKQFHSNLSKVFSFVSLIIITLLITTSGCKDDSVSPESTLTGAWETTIIDEASGTMNLTESGSTVTGILNLDGYGTKDIEDGISSKSTIEFIIYNAGNRWEFKGNHNYYIIDGNVHVYNTENVLVMFAHWEAARL